ncbi:MAG: sodium:calcium antiporter [Haloferacaceae archaeon]
MANPLGLATGAVAGTALVWWGSELLESASQRISAHYGLPAVVHGAAVVAVGSSFPELASTVLSTLVHGQFDLGVGTIVGSAIFNVLVIPALSTLLSRPMSANRDLVYKEALFYMLSVAVLLLTFSFGVIYFPADGRLVATVPRSLAFVPVLLYGLYAFIQYQDTSDHDAGDAPSDVDPGRQWLRLGTSLFVVVVGVELLVRAAIGFGELFGTPPFLWGLTVVAAGTSLPDAFVSVRAARDDQAVTSLANVLGSNVFDLLVAIPAGVLVAGSATVDYAAAVPMMGFLTLSTLVLFTAMRTDLELTTREARLLLGVYAVFLAWMAAETAGVTAFVPR